MELGAVPEISVIIPVRNGRNVIPRCLEALSRQEGAPLFEVLVVDDGSTDGTADMAEKAGVRVLRQPPSGPAAARNLGAREANGGLLVFTDADCEPLPDFLYQLTKPFQNPEAGGAKGAYLTRQTSLTARFVQFEYESKYERMKRFTFIDFVDTYAAAFRASLFREAGGFREDFPNASVEDQEFSFRLAERGIKLIFVPEAKVYHCHAATVWRYFRKKWKIGYWKVLVLKRHPGKVASDSHTPQTLKIQMGLTLGILSGILGGFLFQGGWWLAEATAAISVLLELPFMGGTARKDLGAALATPFFVWVRSLALAGGMVVGAVRFLRP